ncbi:2-keto-4-pentenoate hydratase [Priestia taiwanensis]|uniref:2-keto-4-pentenoate hydratase n=1 Tax=Priestia taiwanensis TaxID=1347902 RepID=A0A917AMI3_9BACI|nr:fumarylacetoacetate hydrolase family protein [Priestia taiwanensis]MBM7362266.1 2-keto-4-pentenoate hydratase [Priestia taiwanensis]GGE60825.1 2-keto-4-pentenoate hydratase [Priestia taiwanensis]
MQTSIRKLAEELLEAEKHCKTIEPLTMTHSNLTIEDAYFIQLEVAKQKLEEGRRVIGKKVGLTSKAMQIMLGVDEPDYGHLFDDMLIENNESVSMGNLISPKVEAEIGFMLKEDLVGPNVTYIDVLMATDYVVPTIEVIDSRIRDWKIRLIDTVADNGSSAKVVVGDKSRAIDELDLRNTSMTLYKNSHIVETGAGAAALGHPAHAVAWLANKLHTFNRSLKAGELILPGALSAAVPVKKGDQIVATFGGLGSVSVEFQ